MAGFNNIVTLAPPLNVTNNDMEFIAEKLAESVKAVGQGAHVSSIDPWGNRYGLTTYDRDEVAMGLRSTTRHEH